MNLIQWWQLYLIPLVITRQYFSLKKQKKNKPRLLLRPEPPPRSPPRGARFRVRPLRSGRRPAERELAGDKLKPSAARSGVTSPDRRSSSQRGARVAARRGVAGGVADLTAVLRSLLPPLRVPWCIASLPRRPCLLAALPRQRLRERRGSAGGRLRD